METKQDPGITNYAEHAKSQKEQ